jgi:hypothetical protein
MITRAQVEPALLHWAGSRKSGLDRGRACDASGWPAWQLGGRRCQRPPPSRTKQRQFRRRHAALLASHVADRKAARMRRRILDTDILSEIIKGRVHDQVREIEITKPEGNFVAYGSSKDRHVTSAGSGFGKTRRWPFAVSLRSPPRSEGQRTIAAIAGDRRRRPADRCSARKGAPRQETVASGYFRRKARR